LLHLARLEHQADAEVVDAGVVRDAGEILHALFNQSGNRVLGNSTQAEAAERQQCAVGDVLHRLGGIGDNFIHSSERFLANRRVSQGRQGALTAAKSALALEAPAGPGSPRSRKFSKSSWPTSIWNNPWDLCSAIIQLTQIW